MGDIVGEKPSTNKRSAFSKPAIVGAIGAVSVSLLPLAVEDASMTGVSQLLSLTYLITWVAILVRSVIHLRKGYWRDRLKGPLLFELASMVLIGTSAWLVFFAEDPQIPGLLAAAAVGAVIFFFAAGKLEEARAELVSEGITIERASDVVRASKYWKMLCRRIGQIHFKPVKRVREFFSRPDTRPGEFSLAAAISALVLAVVALVSTGLVVASVLFPLQLTPEDDRNGKQISTHRKGRVQEPKEISLEDAPANVDDCQGWKPGLGIPEPERSSLRLGWEDVEGIQPGPMEALGFEIAGCPGVARPIPGMKGSWFQPGYCGEELRAIVIAQQGMEHPITLLEQAANFALPLIVNGKFTGATDRFQVGVGDAYIVDSPQGSNVLIRDQASAGPVQEEGTPAGGCAGFTDEDVEYTHVGPAMIEPWRLIAAISLGGVYPITYAHESANSEVVFRSPAGIVAQGICMAEGVTCTIDIGEEQIHGRRGTFIDESEVKALVEP